MHMPRGKPPQQENGHAMNTMNDMDMSGMDMSGDAMDMSGMDMSDGDMDMSGMTPQQNYQMMVDMAMSTSQLPWAIALGIASALLLCVLIVKTPWPLSNIGPTQDATTAVGELLLSRYMIAFEGAAFLILAGIAGAVIFARREHTPEKQKNQPMQHGQEPETMVTAGDDTGKQVYTCPMHPDIRQPQPGNCPKCGMQLIPATEKVASGMHGSQGSHSGHEGQSEQGGHV